MKKKIVLLPLLGFILASCGSNPPQTDSGEGGGNQTQQTEELTEAEKVERISTNKASAKSRLDELVIPLINKITNEEIKQLVQTFYNSEKGYIEAIIDFDESEGALAKVVSDFASFTIQTLRPNVITKLNALINPIISEITVQELKTAVQNFYNNQITTLNGVSSASDIVDYLLNLKDDVLNFVTSETGRLLVEFKNQALNELEELLNPLIAKIPNDYLKQSVQGFVSTEKQYLQGITDLSEAKAASSKVVTDIGTFTVTTFKPLVIDKLNEFVNPLISEIGYQDLKDSVQTFYNNQITTLNSVSTLSDLIDAFSSIKTAFEEFVVSEAERILTALKNEAIEELDPYVTTLISKIPYEEIEDDVNEFYLEQKATLLAVSSFDDVPTTVDEIKEDVFDFILSETKKVALAKLEEIVDEGIEKIPNEDLKTDLSNFAEEEFDKLEAVSKIEDVPTELATVTAETLSHIKSLLATTVKDYIDKLTQIETATAYDYLPEAMSPTYENNLVEASEIAYNFEDFTNVSDISQKGFGEQWQMVVDNINQSTKLAKVFNVAQTALNAATVLVKAYIDNSYTDEMDYEFSGTGFTGSFSYEDLTLSFEIEMTSDIEVPLAGTVKPVIKMTYDLFEDKKEIFISLGDAYKLKYVISDDEYEMATTYGVTIGDKSGSRSSYLGISIDNGVTTGHIYEYTSLQDSDLIKACADFYVANGYVSVVGNKASGLVGSTATINELYSESTGRLLGYMVEEDIKSVIYHTFWFNLKDINNILNVKCIPNGKVDPTENHSDVYVNDSTEIFTPARNKVLFVETSRKYDIELRSHYYYSEVEDTYVCNATEVPMMMIQDDDANYDTIYNNSNFTDFPNDMNSKSGISNAYLKLDNNVISKIRNDCKVLGLAFKRNKENMSSEAIKAYLGIVEG